MSHVSTFSRRQLRSLHLAGTVAIPTPYPEVGRLSLSPHAVAYEGDEDASDGDLMIIEHVQSNRLTITRSVRLDDVTAVLFASAVNPTDLAEANWYFGPEIAAQLEARSNSNDAALSRGIAYVREHASILMQVEVGMTAAESAEYYPPLVGERSDAHYDLGFAPTPCGCVRPVRPCGCFNK